MNTPQITINYNAMCNFICISDNIYMFTYNNKIKVTDENANLLYEYYIDYAENSSPNFRKTLICNGKIFFIKSKELH